MPWTQQKLLLELSMPRGDDDPYYGSSVSFSGDGNILAVGITMFVGDAVQEAGGVYIYDWNGSDWIYRNVIIPFDGTSQDYFGSAVLLTDDGNTIFVAAKNWEGSVTNQGCVYVYDRNESTWTYRAMIKHTSGNYFGTGLAKAEDINELYILNGNTYVYIYQLGSLAFKTSFSIGLTGVAIASTPDGKRKVVTTTSTVITYNEFWGQLNTFNRSIYYTLQSSTQYQWGLGAGLGISPDGILLVAGCPNYTRVNTGQGYIIGQGGVATLIWDGVTNTWVHKGTLFITNSVYGGSYYGSCVALSKSLTLAVGAPQYVYSAVMWGMVITYNQFPFIPISGKVKIGTKFSEESHKVELVDLTNNLILLSTMSEPITGKFDLVLYDAGSLTEADVIIYSNEYITDELLE